MCHRKCKNAYSLTLICLAGPQITFSRKFTSVSCDLNTPILRENVQNVTILAGGLAIPEALWHVLVMHCIQGKKLCSKNWKQQVICFSLYIIQIVFCILFCFSLSDNVFNLTWQQFLDAYRLWACCSSSFRCLCYYRSNIPSQTPADGSA